MALSILLLAGCATCVAAPPPPIYRPAEPPSSSAIREAVKKGAAEEKLSGALDITVARRKDRGLGRYYVCLREANPPSERRGLTYTVFFEGDEYKGVWLSLIAEACEPRLFSPFRP